jgi:predicted small secreted protein
MAHRRLQTMAGVAALAAALAACNLIAGLGEDFRLDTDGSITPGEDGGLDGSNADGSLPDGSPLEGSSDAPPGDGGKLENFCDVTDAGAKGYCWDFEQAGSGPKFNWDTPFFENDASIVNAAAVVQPGIGIGGSHALEVYLSQTGTNLTSNVWLPKPLASVGAPSSLSRIEVDFDFNVVQVNGLYSAGIGMITFPSAASPKEFGISTYQNGNTISRLVSVGTEASITLDTWHHVRIVLVKTDGSATFSETVDVTPDGGSPTNVETRSGLNPGSGITEIRLGVFSTAGGTGDMRVRFDHLVVRRF